MKCPNCQTSCPDDTSFCPQCDAVLDKSLLEMSLNAPGDDGDFAPQPKAQGSARPHRKRPAGSRGEHGPRKRSADGEERPRKRRAAPISAPEESSVETSQKPASGSGGYAGKYAQYWVDDDPPLKKAEAPVMSTEGGKSRRYGEGIQVTEYDTGDLSALPNDPLAMVKDSWTGFLALPLFQRVSVAASVGLFFFSMMPWSTYIGESGYEDSAYVATNFLGLFLSLVAIASLVIRRSGSMPQIPRKPLLLAPLAAGVVGALAIVLTAVYLLANDVYSPFMSGLALSFISACVMFVAGGLSLMKKE